MTPDSRPSSTRYWRILQRVLPEWYRRAYGAALLEAHEDLASARGGAPGVRFWAGLTFDVVLTAIQLRFEHTHPGSHQPATSGVTMIGFRQDLGYALRAMGRRRVTTVLALMTLGLGI